MKTTSENMDNLSKWLMEEKGFKKFYNSKYRIIDVKQFSCVLKISPIHHLYYSDVYGYFTLAENHDEPVSHPASTEKVFFTFIMVPKLARTKDVCETILKAFVTEEQHKTFS